MQQQLVLNFANSSTYSSHDFVQGPCNADALALIQHPDRWIGYGLIVYGREKTGKTHLAHIFSEMHQGRFCALSDLAQLKEQDWVEHDTYYILDHPFACYLSLQTELFHFLNLLKMKNSKLLWIAPKPSSHWPITLPDLKSRISLMLTVKVEQPDDTVLTGILQKRAADMQIVLSPLVISYLLTRKDRSIGTLLNTLEKLNTLALEKRERITIPFIRKHMP